MNLSKWTIAVLLSVAPVLHVQANALQCKELFPKVYKTQEFVISIEGKNQSKEFLAKAHDNLIAQDDPIELNIILNKISEYGAQSLTPEQTEFIFKFRQNSSLLRSIFQTSDKTHVSPDKFARFVKDFGVLKDFLLMKDNENVQLMAIDILKKYSDLNFKKLIKKARPASKKSVALYFNSILENAKKIMDKGTMTIDEVHDVRKHLRDVLRYMQIERDLAVEAGKPVSTEKEDAIHFLKKLNTQLGFVCDQYAAQILNDKDSTQPDRITKKTLVEFPSELRPKVEHFLNLYTIEVVE